MWHACVSYPRDNQAVHSATPGVIARWNRKPGRRFHGAWECADAFGISQCHAAIPARPRPVPGQRKHKPKRTACGADRSALPS